MLLRELARELKDCRTMLSGSTRHHSNTKNTEPIMPCYMIGDVQGCDEPLSKLLEVIDFSPSRDTLYFLGDLVNRGPGNLSTLNRLMNYGTSAVCLLGNHDLHFLGIEQGLRTQKNGDTVSDLLNAPNRDEIVRWLRTRSLAAFEKGTLMVHAGVFPSWTVQNTLSLAKELEQELSGPSWGEFLRTLFGNSPNKWDDALKGEERARAIVNALTRMRFCSENAEMEFTTKGPAHNAPPGYYPWFAVPNRKTANTQIAFGHWSALNPSESPGDADALAEHNVLSLDTGCVWGGCLSAVELAELESAGEDSVPEMLGAHVKAHTRKYEYIQIKCAKTDLTINRVV